ncbi:MAG TPA: T9SS type A sorting domain-containing protein [Bacteroidia bacterium]|nr:T9SS type A sorting domain-containing protein [Bacteroidia bacterium]
MKKIILSIFTCLGLSATAQTLTYANSSPAWYNPTYQTSQCDSTGIVPGASGAGAAWSFTPTNLHSTQTFTTSNTLPGVAEYSAANVSVFSSTANISYYHSDVNDLKYYGGTLTVGAFPVKLVFANPAVYAHYPMALSSSTTSSPTGSITIGGAITGTFTGNATATATGTGTLTLPLKTFTDIVRVTTTQNLNATLSFGVGSLNTVTDDYYSPSASKAPIFSIQTSTISSTLGGTSTQTIVTVQPNYNVVGVNSISKSDIELSVFPNPATTFINFSTNNLDATKIIAYDMTGKVVATEVLENGSVKMNTSNLASGVYMYQVTNKENQTLTTGKFNINK